MYEIVPDEYPIDPREDYDHVTTIVTVHRHYGGGDFSCYNADQASSVYRDHREAIEWSKRRGLFREIKAYIHSGISVQLDDYGTWPDQQWDCGPFGSIFIDPTTARHHLGIKRLTKARLAQLSTILEAEFAEWKAWLEGDSYLVLDQDKDVIFNGTYSDCQSFIKEHTP